MKPNCHVVYRDFDSSPALNEAISKKLDKLYRYTDDISSSRIVVDAPHKHKHKGRKFRAQVELVLKGQTVAFSSDNDSAYVALRDAFSSAERKVRQGQKGSRHRKPELVEEDVNTDHLEEEFDWDSYSEAS